MKELNRKIVFENGKELYGYGFGANTETIGEMSFCTSMGGYQEMISNPSCIGEIAVMTYPVLGNYGITDEDFEARVPVLGGIVVRDYNDYPSNFRYTKTLSEYLEENNIPGISGVDTRMITRMIRDKGNQKIIITDAKTPNEEAILKIKKYRIPKNLVERVSCKKRWYQKTANPEFNIVAIDCGIKLSNIRELSKKGCNVTVVPYNTFAEEILKLQPDGIFISNGPGNPEEVEEVIETVKELKGKVPIFGICLGFQIICLAYGGKVHKMKLGHHGENQPVKNLITGKIEITSQNHSYTVDGESLKDINLKITGVNVLDNTVEAVECKKDKVLAVQYHPEAAPGPQDTKYLFDKFIEMMK